MKSLVNENLKHVKYGKGKIVGEEIGKVEVEFEKEIGRRRFLFPDAFCGFLIFDNPTLQKECELIASEKRKRLEEEKEELRLEYIRQEEERRKVKTVKKKKVITKSMAKSKTQMEEE